MKRTEKQSSFCHFRKKSPKAFKLILFLAGFASLVILAFSIYYQNSKDSPAALAAVPSVYRVSPMTGSTSGGDKVIIYGSDFDSATIVSISGVTNNATFRKIDNYRIELTMPPSQITGAVSFSVSNSNYQTGDLRDAYFYENITTPQVTGVSAGQGLIFGGEEVTITGNNLDGMKWKQVSTGQYHSCGVGLDDWAYCWGS